MKLRIEQLTFSRFLAAIIIVVFHFGRDIIPFNYSNTQFILDQANLGVSYFFILSGFVLSIAYNKHKQINFISFIQRRFARLYPIYILAIILMFLYVLLISYPIDKYITGMILNIFMIQSWFPDYALSFNVPGWSLSVEMVFYIAFPFVYNFLYKPLSWKKFVRIILAFFIISQLIFHILLYPDLINSNTVINTNFVYYNPLMHINQFLIGILTGVYFIKKQQKPKNNDLLIILLTIVAILILKYNQLLIFHNGLFALIFVPLILLIANNTGIITKISNKKIPIFLGEISYGIYILQYPTFRLSAYVIKNYLGIHNEIIIFYISLISLIVVAGLSYKFIEIPIRDKINSFNLFSNKKVENS